MKQTVPLKLGDRVVGTAVVEQTDAGVHVLSTHVEDPDVAKALSIDIGPMYISSNPKE